MFDDERRAGPPRLDWQGVEGLTAADLAALTGPGAPYELIRETSGTRRPLVFREHLPNVRAMFDAVVARHPDAGFLAAGDRSWTYAEGAAQIDAIAAVLAHRYGVGPGDRVAFVAANHPEYVLGLLAVQTLGAIVAGLNGWWTGPEMSDGVDLTKPVLLVGDEARLARIDAATMPADLPIISLDQLADAAGAEVRRRPDVTVTEDMPALILFTSGTTGRPKGATLSHGNIVHFVQTMQFGGDAAVRMAADPSVAPRQPAAIVTGPLFHVSGTNPLYAGIGVGALCVLTPPGRWDARTFVELTVEHGVGAWGGVPTYYWRILRLPDLADHDLSCLAKAGNGGGPVAPELLRLFAEKLPWVAVSNTLGMTETTGLGVNNNSTNIREHPDAVGTPMMSVEAEVRDELRRSLPEGEVGEICFRTASVFLGYWDNPEATARAVDDEGWYHTGDHGRIVEGLVYMDSRLRDMIIRGGENIYPMEIEHRLVAHPGILEAAVIGTEHVELGQEVTAVVVTRPGVVAGCRLGALVGCRGVGSVQGADVRRRSATRCPTPNRAR